MTCACFVDVSVAESSLIGRRAAPCYGSTTPPYVSFRKLLPLFQFMTNVTAACTSLSNVIADHTIAAVGAVVLPSSCQLQNPPREAEL
jgi:hypothetical protein